MEPSPISLMLFVGALAAVLAYLRWCLQYWKRRNVPFLEPTLPFGNLENPITNRTPFQLQILQFYKRFREMRVNIGGIYLFTSPVLLIIDPKHIKQILIKDFQNFHERGFYCDEKHEPLSINLFTVDGPKWRTLRTKYTPTFTSLKMKIMFNLMTDAEKLLEKHINEQIASKKPFDVKDSIERVSSDVIGTCVFGIDCNSFEDETFRNMLKDGAEGATTSIKLSFCNALPNLARFLRIPLIPRNVANYISSSIENTVNYRKRVNVSRNDFLQLVTEMKEDNIITMDELKASCIQFFLAGFESSANTMVLLLFELAYNQEIQQKLRKAINEGLAKYNGEISYEAVMNIQYLDIVLCETLRKYTPAAFLNRRCVENFHLSSADVVIEKGTDIIIPVNAIQTDPEYFPDPENFEPERFSDENRHNIKPFTYMPFGEGPRNCIGDRFAKQEIKIMAASLIRKYLFKLHKRVSYPLTLKFTGIFNKPAEDILFDVEEVREA